MKQLAEVLNAWEAVIGLEVHTELTTLNTKMFCGCKIEYGAPPNTHVCPVCLGLPGALPVPNRAAIESIVLAGLATGCEIEKRSMFYRKNYFYPDMSKNFQTTQGPVAFCMRGSLELTVPGGGGNTTHNGYTTHIGITRIHMEEDAGKMVHVGGESGRITGATMSLVDYNRCGTPLIELVTEPDLRTPEEARLFLQKLRSIYLTLGISDCSMEEGSLRCDGNVSLRPRGATTLGTKTELKNMNSFKNLHDGLAYEICRQAQVLEEGGAVVQETRHWEPAARRTVSMRVKETASDYRLFPEPDLAPYDLSDEFIEAVRAKLPELPAAKAARYVRSYALAAADAEQLAASVDTSRFFDDAAAYLAAPLAEHPVAPPAQQPPARQAPAQQPAAWQAAAQLCEPAAAAKIASLLLNDVAALLNAGNLRLDQIKLTPKALAELAQLLTTDTVSSKQGKELLATLAQNGGLPGALAAKLGLEQVSNADELEAIARTIIEENPDKAAAYRGGKTGLMGFFVGQVMQATKGQANPKLTNETFTRLLKE